jgi:hypothetical protein
MRRGASRVVGVAALVALVCAVAAPENAAPAAPAAITTFARLGAQAESTLLHVFYAGKGQWRFCDQPTCGTGTGDWGVDSLTYTLYFRWRLTHERALVPVMKQLLANGPTWGAPCTTTACGSWSDVPAWDSIAALREYEATGHDPGALIKAQLAYDAVEQATVYRVGACPEIRYQQPNGSIDRLKTLETDANAIKAGLLLYQVTGAKPYLTAAWQTYAAVRGRFFEPARSLYSVYVFDDGHSCRRVPHRYFASVNGDMIWSGIQLARATHDAGYLQQATATARAVATSLADPAGVFADLQAENDIVEPLVEAMYDLATLDHAGFARAWILRNAAAAVSARARTGAYGRFFDGPAPTSLTTAWQSNGGLALEMAAAALDPAGRVSTANTWAGATFHADDISALPSSVTFTGSQVAFIGTLGERCCQDGHARVLVDGVETVDGTGIWQDKSSLGQAIPGTVLFAWRWPASGTHTITFEPGAVNAKEGGPFLHLAGYFLVG